MELLRRIVAGYASEEEDAPGYFQGDTLFTPLQRMRGLPLGNQTSQFFANVYLNRLDQRIEQELQPGAYARYVDDFLLFASDKAGLNAMRTQVSSWLADVRLRLHEGKSRIYRSRDGVSFLGWQIFPWGLRLARSNVVRFRRRLWDLQAEYESGAISWEKLEARIRAWIAHASHGNTFRLREELFDAVVLRRPHRQSGGTMG